VLFLKLWNKDYTKRELMKHVGDISAVCGIRHTVLDDGPGRGMRVLDVDTGSGLQFSVLPDRGLDISTCRYKSIPLGFISKTGHVAPGFCTYGGTNFLRYFTGGLLTTCGYTHQGAPCVDEGVSLGLHGYATTLVSDNTSSQAGWDGDDYTMRIQGMTRESRVFGENLHLHRTISAKAGENKIIITDKLENAGFEPQPMMMLYHFNFGHPLVGENTTLVTGGRNKIVPKDDTAAAGLSRADAFECPTPGYAEQVFYHDLTPDADGSVSVGLINPDLGIGVHLKFFKHELPYLIEWKQMGEGDYVCGLEPATNKPEGRDKARECGELGFIQPSEIKTFNIELVIEELTA